MDNKQIDFLINVINVEKERLLVLRADNEWLCNTNEVKKINIKINLCNSTLLSLKGGK